METVVCGSRTQSSAQSFQCSGLGGICQAPPAK
jgi:hypothetical protein